VVSVVLVPPAWRPNERVCIELLHDQDTLHLTDGEGRRLFLSEEFDERTGLHTSRKYYTPHPGGTTLVREEVLAAKDGRSVGLSKVAFANYISARAAPFAEVDFAGFRATFAAIREAVKEATEDISDSP